MEFDKHEKLVIISKITLDKMKIESFNVILSNEISITFIAVTVLQAFVVVRIVRVLQKDLSVSDGA